MGIRLRTRTVAGWLLAVAALVALGAASLMAQACERETDGAGAAATHACAAHRAPPTCCTGGGACAMLAGLHAPVALLPASDGPPGPAAAPVPDVVGAWPAFVVLAPPSAVVAAAGPPPALAGVVLLN